MCRELSAGIISQQTLRRQHAGSVKCAQTVKMDNSENHSASALSLYQKNVSNRRRTGIYVVVEEFIPESQVGDHSSLGTIGAALGFILMMALDVALG